MVHTFLSSIINVVKIKNPVFLGEKDESFSVHNLTHNHKSYLLPSQRENSLGITISSTNHTLEVQKTWLFKEIGTREKLNTKIVRNLQLLSVYISGPHWF